MTTTKLKNIPLLKITLYPVYLSVKQYYYNEHKINRIFGKMLDKQVYIIRRPPKDYGFFSNFFYVLGHLCYA